MQSNVAWSPFLPVDCDLGSEGAKSHATPPCPAGRWIFRGRHRLAGRAESTRDAGRGCERDGRQTTQVVADGIPAPGHGPSHHMGQAAPGDRIAPVPLEHAAPDPPRHRMTLRAEVVDPPRHRMTLRAEVVDAPRYAINRVRRNASLAGNRSSLSTQLPCRSLAARQLDINAQYGPIHHDGLAIVKPCSPYCQPANELQRPRCLGRLVLTHQCHDRAMIAWLLFILGNLMIWQLMTLASCLPGT